MCGDTGRQDEDQNLHHGSKAERPDVGTVKEGTVSTTWTPVGLRREIARSTFASSSDAMRKALDWELDPVSGLASTALLPRDPK